MRRIMLFIKFKGGTHIVIKNEDIDKYLTFKERLNLRALIAKIDVERIKDSKGINNYYIVNTDESYAEEVLDLILTREGENTK